MKKRILKPVLAVGALIGGIILLCTLMSKSPVAVKIAKEEAENEIQQAAQIAAIRAEAEARAEAVQTARLKAAAERAKAEALAKSGFDAGYRVGLDIANSLGSNRRITAREVALRAGERQKQYAQAGAEIWDDGFGTGLGRALIAKDVTVIIEGSGYSRGGVFYLDN
jgi:hypothetical protein